ncbi:protein mono-ADP-ribosyltransferase PARP3 [Vidua macroura]|uniref:protein mono-ADP-ribosyltransferase PARP3 n=1 Tax=Vidua macroura TaxID=187451 RepID=UPI0023A80ABF|nr:protein mono-ADP-ribosyltransferase PARP3 [Vidua macroura]
MASKHQASSSKQPENREKKPKGEEEDDTWRSTLATLKIAPKEKRPATIDGLCPLSTALGARVYEDYDCTLNQTNISANNNKFYIIQFLEHNGAYSVWSHWGRVVSPPGHCSSPPALFLPASTGMGLVEQGCRGGPDLVSLIFRSDMFWDAMQTMNIDVKKMPLGKLTKQQIARGFEALEELEAALREQPPEATRLEELSSRFYTIIPHNFGRARPPIINSPDLLCAKKDMLLVLAHIEVAQSLQAQKEKEEEEEEEKEVAHPLDQNYALLCCQLSLLDRASQEYQLIQTYVMQTGRKLRILNIWQVARDGEDERFKAHDLLEHRRLLWHGTNMAEVVAILKSGLHIVPHPGGRLGEGIYFASESSKSACHVGCTSKKVGIMFLTEVALGKPYRITCNDPTLRQPPAGYDSVLACGRTEPDPAQDEEVLLDGKKVLVCQGKPIPMPTYKDSSFSQSEYVIYKESQCRIRYLVQLQF